MPLGGAPLYLLTYFLFFLDMGGTGGSSTKTPAPQGIGGWHPGGKWVARVAGAPAENPTPPHLTTAPPPTPEHSRRRDEPPFSLMAPICPTQCLGQLSDPFARVVVLLRGWNLQFIQQVFELNRNVSSLLLALEVRADRL